MIGTLTGPAAATKPVSNTPATTAPTTVPSPVLTGPIRATARPGDPSHDYPFFATDQDLRAYGHVEEEYFIEGTANRYTTPDGATGTIVGEWLREPDDRLPGASDLPLCTRNVADFAGLDDMLTAISV